jgi:C4-dicarboxylate-specific signal transduction histidine kinase
MQERETELRDKQEQLVQTAKLATLGELTTGIAHELNNPLNNIGLFLGNVLDHLDYGEVKTDAIRSELRKAMQQVRKATEIISHLRTFGRATTITREPVRINEVIGRSVSLIAEQLRLREIEVVFGLTDQDPVVTGHSIQLEQVFVNLLTNARDALAKAERKRIEISSACSVDGAGSEGVVIRVRDTGTGIPPGQEQRIFDPFFTTKEVGQGTGLGLSIIYGIVNEHRGSIEVENHPDGGAMFTLRLPASEPSEED